MGEHCRIILMTGGNLGLELVDSFHDKHPFVMLEEYEVPWELAHKISTLDSWK